VLWRMIGSGLVVRSERPLDWMKFDERLPGFGERRHSTSQVLVPPGRVFLFNVLAYARGKCFDGAWTPKPVEDYLPWFAAKSVQCGFSIHEHNIVRFESQHLEMSSESIDLLPAEISGVLEVIDPNAFRNILKLGIGRMRAYGCGLLLLKNRT
jgi:hypothetical protein